MQVLHIVLFVAVAAFALTLLGVLVRSRVLRLQARPVPPERPEAAREGEPREAGAADPPRAPASAGLLCPACRRAFPLGLKYCPHDARALVPAGDPAVRSMAPGVTCPTCRRSFDSNKKFCPYDAEELVPIALTTPDARAMAVMPRVLGKICPHCAQRDESEATFCGRDGSELVSVN